MKALLLVLLVGQFFRSQKFARVRERERKREKELDIRSDVSYTVCFAGRLTMYGIADHSWSQITSNVDAFF